MKIQEIARKGITMQAFFWKGLDLPVNCKRDHEYFRSDETQYELTQCKKAIFCLVCFIRKSFLVLHREWTNRTTFVSVTNLTHNSFILYQYVCYTIILDMFRELTCPSSGGQIVLSQHLVSSLSVNGCTAVCSHPACCTAIYRE